MHVPKYPNGRGQLLPLFLLALLTANAAAAEANNQRGCLGDCSWKGPWGEPYDQFEEALASPNATGSFAISGPNVSVASGGSDVPTVEGWAWKVSLRGDIPLTNESSDATDEDVAQGRTYTGVEVALVAPGTLVAPLAAGAGNTTTNATTLNITAVDGWEICINIWDFFGSDEGTELRQETDGSCKSVLSDDCLAALESATSTPSNCACPDLSRISACADYQGKLGDGCVGFSYNATGIRSWPTGRTLVAQYGSMYASSERGNTTDYNLLGTYAVPVRAAFRYRDPDTGTVFSSGSPQMFCVKANSSDDDSATPSDSIATGSAAVNIFVMAWISALSAAYILV